MRWRLRRSRCQSRRSVLDRVRHDGKRRARTCPTRLRETEPVGRTSNCNITHTHTHAFLSLCPSCPESGAGVTHSVVLPSEGVFCAHFWDGFLCWEETPAGKSVTKTCPDQPDLDLDSAGETNHTDEKTNSRFSALTFMCKKPLICVMGVKGQGVSRVIRLYLTGSVFAQLFIRICNVLKHLTPDLQILNDQINTFMRF